MPTTTVQMLRKRFLLSGSRYKEKLMTSDIRTCATGLTIKPATRSSGETRSTTSTAISPESRTNAERVGHHPWRIEAEDMTLDGYKIYAVSPFETTSGSVAIVTSSNRTAGAATTKLNSPSGTYDLAVNYYDLYGGRSQWQIYLNDQQVGAWLGNSEDVLSHTPSIYLDGHSATRIKFRDVKVNKGDMLKIVGTPDGVKPAPLDYVAVLPRGVVD